MSPGTTSHLLLKDFGDAKIILEIRIHVAAQLKASKLIIVCKSNAALQTAHGIWNGFRASGHWWKVVWINGKASVFPVITKVAAAVLQRRI